MDALEVEAEERTVASGISTASEPSMSAAGGRRFRFLRSYASIASVWGKILTRNVQYSAAQFKGAVDCLGT